MDEINNEQDNNLNTNNEQQDFENTLDGNIDTNQEN